MRALMVVAATVSMGCSAPVVRQGKQPRTGAVEKLERVRSTVKWSNDAVLADVTLDGIADVVQLGHDGSTLVIGVVEGPPSAGSRAWVLDLPSEDACGPTSALELETPVLPLELWGCAAWSTTPECVPVLRIKKRIDEAAAKGTKGAAVRTGDCDAFHLFFDGMSVRVWRR